MTKKTKLILALVAVAGLSAYSVYWRVFGARTPIGGLCSSGAMCDGQCLGFGDLLPDYSHQEICTQACAAAADCPSPTTCQSVQVISTDGTGVKTEDKGYCLPTDGLPAA